MAPPSLKNMVEGEFMGSKLIGCKCNLPMTKNKIKQKSSSL
jgi:hypothetical protein